MPCIETFLERKVNRSPDDTEICSVFKNDPFASISALFPSLLLLVFLPPSSTWHWVTSPRTHATECFLWFGWKFNPEHTESKFSAYKLMFAKDWCHKSNSFGAHSPIILSLKGVERSQWSCVGECSREFPSPFSQILHTHTHTHTHTWGVPLDHDALVVQTHSHRHPHQRPLCAETHA